MAQTSRKAHVTGDPNKQPGRTCQVHELSSRTKRPAGLTPCHEIVPRWRANHPDSWLRVRKGRAAWYGACLQAHGRGGLGWLPCRASAAWHTGRQAGRQTGAHAGRQTSR
eukprot:357985-Chlamydomonas_euryale.AAC.6